MILLAHDPRRLAEAAELKIPLVLSGHTHGGQVVLPVLGAVAAQKFPVIAGIGRQRRAPRSSSAAASARCTCRSGSTARPKSRSSRSPAEAQEISSSGHLVIWSLIWSWIAHERSLAWSYPDSSMTQSYMTNDSDSEDD